ncbi:MFS transporter [Glutamicibacter sp. JL.03c]|uniref:MFS transporter n=1 Tax=Glutamicibacter sp. JL.03c TaxID=2984842 RepID=UPI0021F7639E|nr:MFS transporter [Glutamicibacter sp. JL.03c]UYQ77537.1 MFS transporter [Glutamicibacter sp. JL.03c]
MNLPAKPDRAQGASLGIVLVTYAIAMCGTTMPTALYPTLQDEYGLSTAASTQLFAIYAIVVLTVLCLFGSLSDAIGRKPVMIIGLLSSAASGALYAVAADAPMLFIARILSGVCAGLVTGTATAYLTDLVSSSARGAGISSVANMVGLGSGPALAAFLTYYLSSTPMIAFSVHAVLSGVCMVLLALTPDTVAHRGRRLKLSLPLVPRFALRDYCLGGLMTLGFAVMGGCTAMTSILVVRAFGITDLRLLGLIGSLIFVATTVGQKAGGKLVSEKAYLGFAGLMIGTALIALAPRLQGSIAVMAYLFGLLVAGLSHGALFPVGLGIVLRRIELRHRGSASSAFWVLGYALTALGALGLGWVGQVVGESMAVTCFGITIALCSVACLLLHRRWSMERAGRSPIAR